MGELKNVSGLSESIQKTVENLSLMDDDLMSHVFDHNIPATQLVIRTILKQDVDVIEVSGQEDMNNPLVGGRSIRLDILAKDRNGRRFDCEVQRNRKGAHPRRVRFHSAMMDSRMLSEGEEFSELKDSYVIFITETDHFNEGKPIYFIERKRDGDKPFPDGSYIIYVNGAYTADDDMGRLMEDFRRRDLRGFHYKVLEEGVRHFKEEEEGKAIMCEAVEKLAKEYAQGQFDDGLKKATEDLISNMLRNGMSAEMISQCTEVDLEYVKKIEKTALQTV